jgi:hypothetical protein
MRTLNYDHKKMLTARDEVQDAVRYLIDTVQDMDQLKNELETATAVALDQAGYEDAIVTIDVYNV